MADDRHQELDGATVFLLACACGVTIANIYYNQSMLVDIAATLDPGARYIGWVPTLTQVGYSLGVLFLLPLGDRVERRGLIVKMASSLTVFLLLAMVSPSLTMLCIASLLIGSTSSIAQQIIPFGALLAGPKRGGKVVGTLMSGLLMGILLARALSGAVSAYAGWRAMFGLAAVMVAVFTIVLRRRLPLANPTTTLAYPKLLASLYTLFRTEPVLRQSATMGAMFFASFSVFWSTVAFLLESPPFNLKSDAVGLFALVGAAGVIASPVSGRLSDSGRGKLVLWGSCGLAVASYVVLGLFGGSLIGIVVGVLVLDLAVWAAQTANQQRIFAIAPQARSRINTVYIVFYFAGGAVGSAVGNIAWQHGAWHTVAIAGGILSALPGVILLLSSGRSSASAALPAGDKK
jgi:predicted MFS family arabinose efflux permease